MIGELQPLDVGEAIGAVQNAGNDVVGDGDDIVRRVTQCPVGVDADGVVRPRAGEEDGVEVVDSAGIPRQDLTDDAELAGVVEPADHERDQRLHAVEAVDLGAGPVQILKHADAHVQPVVAVDEVVAAAAFDDVAALAAEDDVARAEGGHADADELLQTVDEGEIGEHAAGEAGDGDRGRVVIVALQDVGVVRSGQTFHAFEPGIDRSVRPRHDRFIERADVEIDGHAERIVLEHGPVEPGLAQVAVTLAAALVADQDVVAAFAIHSVGRAVADVDVVADDLVAGERVGVVGCKAIGGAELDPVVAFVAESFLVHPIAQDKVVAGSADGLADVLAGDHEVVAEPADEQVDTLAAVQDVVAVLALHEVVAADVREDVVAGAAFEDVVAEAALEAVVAGVAVEGVVAFARLDDVIRGRCRR